ncbi:MAG: lamin tail domain-containing protein [Planctomycetota bacterium]
MRTPQGTPKTLLALSLFLLSWTTLAHADWTASGTFSYTDRLYDTSGWTGTQVLPIRYADVQIYDLTTFAVLGAGSTTPAGTFSINVVDTATRDVGIRVLASTNENSTFNFIVADDANGMAVYSYHDAGTDVFAHAPTVDVNFGSIVAPPAIGDVATTEWASQIFNAFDMCAITAEWIAVLNGPTPAPLLTIGWNPTNGRGGSSYSGGANRMNLADDDGYDDPNILHEVGHYVEDEYGRSRNTGGSHTVSDDDQDPRLAWSEGFATYVSAAVLDQWNLPRPDVYSDRNSFGTTGGFAYGFEGNQSGGATQERAVSAVLHDLIDSASTPDSSIGTDDDTLVDRGDDVWAVLQEMRALQTPATNLEDFWDLWFELGFGNLPAMQTIFGNHRIDFFPDAQENNDTPENATVLGGGYVENSFYRNGPDAGGDEDWFVFAATAGAHYDIEVNGAGNSIFGRPDPELFLIDLDTGSLVAYNHDPYDSILNTQSNSGAQQMSETAPRIYWKAPQSKNYYLMLRHSSAELNIMRYGTYQVRAASVSPISPTLTSVAAAPMRPGQTYHALLRGEDFITTATVSTSTPNISVVETRWIAPEAMFVRFAVAAGTPASSYDVTVTQDGGVDTLTAALVVETTAAAAVVINEVDLGGTDRVELHNLGTVAADLTGWELSGRSTGSTPNTFVFPAFSLPAGGRVVVSDGGGTDTATELYDQGATFNWPWSNGSTGDVSLVDAAGRNIDYIRFVLRFVHTHQAPLGSGALWMQPEVRSPPSGFTLARNESFTLYRSTVGLAWSMPTMPNGASGRENLLDRFEDNDTPRRARVPRIGFSTPNLSISPRPSGSDEDWFGVPLAAGKAAVVKIVFNHAAGNLNLQSYAPGEENTPLESATSTNNDEVLAISTLDSSAIGGGLYRFRVFGAGGATNDYALEVHVGDAGPDCDGDGISDALAIASGLAVDANLDGAPDNCGPQITAISPNSGPAAGGTAVVLTGTAFQPGSVPLLGGAPLLNYQYVNGTQVLGVTPPGSAGIVDVTVTTPAGTGFLSPGFLYADTTLRSESTTAPIGATTIPMSVTADTDVAVTGYQFAVDFDSTQLQVFNVGVAGTAAAGASFVVPYTNNGAEPAGGAWGIQVIMDNTPPLDDVLAPGSAQTLAVAEANVLGTASGTMVPLTFVDQVGIFSLPPTFTHSSGFQFTPALEVGTFTVGGELFRRGDCNVDGTRNVADAVFLLTFLFGGGSPMPCDDACDNNDDGTLNIADAVTLLGSLFSGSGPLPLPNDCGIDPTTSDSLACPGMSGCP